MSLSFWTVPFFKQAEEMLNSNPTNTSTLLGMETSILLKCDDRNESFVVRVGSGHVSTKQASSEDKTEFILSAPYEEWAKIARGEEKVQREIVRGKVKFVGSWPKMLLYINKVVRLENEMLKGIGLMTIQY